VFRVVPDHYPIVNIQDDSDVYSEKC
jgi:hypothetical protein